MKIKGANIPLARGGLYGVGSAALLQVLAKGGTPIAKLAARRTLRRMVRQGEESSASIPVTELAALREEWLELQMKLRAKTLFLNFSRCVLCAQVEPPLFADHILPLHLGGDNSEQNLQTLCANCRAQRVSKVIPGWVQDIALQSKIGVKLLAEM